MISKQSLIVAKWEFLRFFKWKQQLISYLLMVLVMAAVVAWSFFVDESRHQYRIAVPAHFTLENTEQFQFQRPTITLDEQLTQLKETQTWHAVVSEEAEAIVVHTLSGKKWQQTLDSELQKYFRQVYGQSQGLSAAQLATLEEPVTLEMRYLDDNYKGSDRPEKMIAIGLLFLLLIGLSTAFGQLLMSITGEKQQRVTEQLFAIVTPQQWIDGKVLGHSLSAMKAMFTTSLVIVLSTVITLLFIADKPVDFTWLNWAVIAWLVPFALIGLLLCACFMAAIAASIDDPNTSGKGVVMMVTWLPLLFTYLVIDSPTGFGMTLLSWLPLTSFAAMPVRLAMVELAWWQPLLSLLLLLGTLYWLRRLAGRIFLRGMQMYGKEPSWGDIMRWALSNKTE
ncbi:ABC transporter permease [Alishewanella sp. SMS8]|uniref:ABC transporter permease n=1 Tax=unclassified Alishewanella TaxID=2628974 RepID=UPI0027418DDF|nr:ABC transporter permease [Alishewanella sp. SMS8]MDP4945002.1 ABC transporter permease [Alishewanella sp.]MDP5207429.1 ABC transporter permease [Alishewanella sp. SMS9]MDP5035960.1 ABC transporter permease [Alishewanella sp.]MDP5186215.1 ABC transporter permease [Alishewanella sp.]MDP5459699.1 ABC transporter permease [Alishewanella sp. SMS8]